MVTSPRGSMRLGLALKTAAVMGLFVLLATTIAAGVADRIGERELTRATTESFLRTRDFVASWAHERQDLMHRDADLVTGNDTVLRFLHRADTVSLPGLGPAAPSAPRCISSDEEIPEGSTPWIWDNVYEVISGFQALRGCPREPLTGDAKDDHAFGPQRSGWAIVSTTGTLLTSCFAKERDERGCAIDYQPSLFPLVGSAATADADCMIVPATSPMALRSGLFRALPPGDAHYACVIPIETESRAVFFRLVVADSLRRFFDQVRAITQVSLAVLGDDGEVVAATKGFEPGTNVGRRCLSPKSEAFEIGIAGEPWLLGCVDISRPGGGADRLLLGRSLRSERDQLRSTERAIALGGLVAFLLGVGLVVLYVRGGWIRRLDKIAGSVTAIAQRSRDPGDAPWPARLQPRGRDEIADLGRELDSMVEGLEVYEEALRRFSSPEIVRLLRTHAAALAARRSNLTVLFTDIANFTHLSEGRDPADVKALLDDYLANMTHVAVAHGAIIDKFIGDAIMAIWGAPTDDKVHALRACQGAIAMRNAANALQARYAERGWPGLKTRLGLNSGVMMVGLIGPEDRSAYTVLGDDVNLASRLEGVNKIYGTEILASEATFNQTSGQIAGREIDRVRVKGKDKSVAIHELIAAGSLPAHVREAVQRYGEALVLYRARKFAEAEAGFNAAFASVAGGDPPSQVMARRCREYASHPPPPDWDGTFTLDTK